MADAIAASWGALLAEDDTGAALGELGWTERSLIDLAKAVAPLSNPAGLAAATAALDNAGVRVDSQAQITMKVIGAGAGKHLRGG